MRKWFKHYKIGKMCSLCKENCPACLDFHHIRPDKKTRSVSRMVNKGWPKKRILREIRKCVVLCSNCHIKLHKGSSMIPVRNRSYIEKYVIRLKNRGYCEMCNEKAPYCLQFDHKESELKCFTIMEGIRKRKNYLEIQAEVEKCRLLCSNCHRKHHFT